MGPRSFLLLLGFGLAIPAGAADVERKLQAELSGADVESFGVENLVGRMRIRAGSGDGVTVTARVFAESAELADAVRVERVRDGKAGATLRVRYPYDAGTFRYLEPGEGRSWPFGHLEGSTYDYDGRRVRVSRGHGKRLWVDLDVEVPAGSRRAAFRNLVGGIEAEGLEGRLRFEVGSAELQLRRLEGEISVEGDSGDIQARDIHGRFRFDSSSGDCRLDGFDGEQLVFHASSGDLVARGVRANRVEADTSSGDVKLTSADIRDFEGETSSGDVRVDVGGSRLASLRVTTSSGDVSLGLPADGSFDARADQSSGDMYVGFREGSEIRDHEELVGYRMGTGGATIRVTTSSGDFSITPR